MGLSGSQLGGVFFHPFIKTDVFGSGEANWALFQNLTAHLLREGRNSLPIKANMFKLNLAEEATKLVGNTAQDKVNSAGQAVQQVANQVTEAGQKAVDDVCKNVQDASEKATQSVVSQVTDWGKSFGQNEEKKNEEKKNEEKKNASS